MISNPPPLLAIVVPCYNEEEVLQTTIYTLDKKLATLIQEKKIHSDSFLCFVDDGSADKTWDLLIEHLHKRNIAIKLSKNFGHQNALLAGLQEVVNRCDCCISIDGDLQQDEDKIDEFIKKYTDGAEIVLGIRRDRNTDGLFKKLTAYLFYSIMSLMGAKTLRNHADYRLMGRRSIEALLRFGEKNLFLRGLIFELGFSIATVDFDVRERFAGKSKYSISKMFSFAWNGIASTSVVPLRVVGFVGILVCVISLCLGVYALFTSIFLKTNIPGWASTVIPMYFLGGIQLFSLGIIGEYIGKIYTETKNRPRYIIEERFFNEQKD
ncbi:glycosyltransferase family 2 protein [Helicobacter cholecystus]|uniref:glycosyltransferase family 2 protein n=1 Tax=Helicobacter cholecystus TaxID=45498 RepID=UPI002738B702|nr:glycosyltransferase family 2 protein [Helicobacter cholecystus]